MKNWIFAFLFLTGCASLDRNCSSCSSEAFGDDWIIVQLDMHGKPFRCWELRNVSAMREGPSGRIYWKDSTGNEVNISSNYNYVHINGNNWSSGYQELGLSAEACRLIQQLKFSPHTDVVGK